MDINGAFRRDEERASCSASELVNTLCWQVYVASGMQCCRGPIFHFDFGLSGDEHQLFTGGMPVPWNPASCRCLPQDHGSAFRGIAILYRTLQAGREPREIYKF